MLVTGETQSVQETRRSPVICHRKSEPKHKIQHATVRRKPESKTITTRISPKVSPARYRGAAEVAPRAGGSPGSSRAAHLLTPSPDSAGLGPEQSAPGPDSAFAKRPGLVPIRRRPAGPVGKGRGGPRRGAVHPSRPHSPPGERALPRPERGTALLDPQAWALDGRPPGGALSARDPAGRPGPRVALQDQDGPGVTFWLTGDSGSCLRAGPLTLLPHCLPPPCDPHPCHARRPIT